MQGKLPSTDAKPGEHGTGTTVIRIDDVAYKMVLSVVIDCDANTTIGTGWLGPPAAYAVVSVTAPVLAFTVNGGGHPAGTFVRH